MVFEVYQSQIVVFSLSKIYQNIAYNEHPNHQPKPTIKKTSFRTAKDARILWILRVLDASGQDPKGQQQICKTAWVIDP